MKNTSFSFWKISGSLIAIVTFFALLVAVNIVFSHIPLRADLTQDKLFTLSDGTRKIISSLDRDVTLKFFFNSSAPEVPAPLKGFARQIEDLLQEYTRLSNGRIVLEKFDPKPDSDAEEWAQRYGLNGQPISMMGPNLFLGIVAISGDHQAIIPVVDPRNQEMLEYSMTRMIYQVSHPRRPVVGVLSKLPVMGVEAQPFMEMAQDRSQPAWACFQNLRNDYDVRLVPPDTAEIDKDIDTVIVVHPKDISETSLFALDQFVLRGGHLLAFVDPLCLIDMQNPSEPTRFTMPRASSDLNRLLATWGVSLDPGRVVADLDASTTVRGRDNQPEQSPFYLSLNPRTGSSKDIATSSLESLLLAFAGAFTIEPKDGLTATPIFSTSENSQMVSAMMAQFGSAAVRRDFKSGMKSLPLAVRMTGTFTTAFPDGYPAPPKEEGSDSPVPPPAYTGTVLAKSAKPGAVIVVGDVDMLADTFCVRTLDFLGYTVAQPFNDNISFFANVLDQLTGSIDLISIRSRGRTDRPFTRVLNLARKAQDRWMLQERELEKKGEMLQQRLSELQSQKDEKQRFILSPEQAREIARFKEEMLDNQRQLKEVRKNLREGIERLGLQIKVINIVAMPLIVAVIGLGLAFYRRHRAVRGQHP